MLDEKLSVASSSHENVLPPIPSWLPIPSSYKEAWSDISLERYQMPPGETPEYALEHHVININMGQSLQLERIIDGRLQTGQVFAGAVGICPIHLPHSFRWDKEANILVLRLQNELLTRNAWELLNIERFELVPHLATQDLLIQQIGLALEAELRSNGSSERLYVETMANALAVHLLRHCSTQGRRNIDCRAGLPAHKLKLVMDYINDYLNRELSLDELAAIAQLSPYHFSRVFKQSTGLSPHKYLIQQRVERAKQLLRQRKMNLSEIALACGFTHQSHLNRHFKRLTGVTPKNFLKS